MLCCVDIVDRMDTCSMDRVDNVDRIERVDIMDRVDIIDSVDM